jgi:hypothetical protein
MKRVAVVAFLLLFVATGMGLISLARAMSGGNGPVLAAPAVADALARDPHAWLGRVVRVRGSVVGIDFGTCEGLCPAWPQGAYLALSGNQGMYRSPALPLRPGGEDPVLGLARRIPLLGTLVPPAQRLTIDVAVYRVRLQAAQCVTGGPPAAQGRCFVAVLLDAAPNNSLFDQRVGAAR